MGKRLRRGGRSPSVLDRALLRRRIVSSNLERSLDAKSVAIELQDRYPDDYRRCQRQPLMLHVEKALKFLQRNSASSSQGDPSSLSSDDSTSTSEDAVSEAKVEPEFDVTKSVLRDCYAKQSKKPTAVKGKEDNMEIETGIDKPTRTMELVSRNSNTVQSAFTGQKSGGEVGREGPRFCDFGGMDGLLKELTRKVIVSMYHPQLRRWIGIRPTTGILLHGPPGCGKTTLAHAIANESGVPFYDISATEIVSGVSGASEENIRDLFEKAYRTAPSIVFIDEIDAIASKRENLQRGMERRIVTQLMTCMDKLHQTLRTVGADKETEASERKPGYVLVIGATNKPDEVDQALRRPGRFGREILLGVPEENARAQILSVLTRNLRLEGKIDLFKIASSTPGFVGADLEALVNEAGEQTMERILDRRELEYSSEHKDKNTDWWKQPWTPDEMKTIDITMADFEEALKIVQPSSKREGFSSIPNVTWEDVGGLNSLRKEFDRYIVQRIKFPERYKDKVKLGAGILLYGPPGCGKTLIAKAVANDAGASFIHIKAAEILNKYVGESELAVRTMFSRARTCSPCIIFFDEVDALTTVRGKEGGWVVERVLSQLLIELDGGDQRQGVYVIGATNRLDAIDPALLRPGRFGKVLLVTLPNADERGLILKALTRKMLIGADVDLDAIGRREACNNLTGADLASLVEEAFMAAVEEKQASLVHGSSSIEPLVIKASHFEKALEEITHSVSEK